MEPQYLVIGYGHAREIMAEERERFIKNFGRFNALDFLVLNEMAIMATHPYDVPRELYRGREVLVCGAVRDVCVRLQVRTLRIEGFNARIFEEASIV